MKKVLFPILALVLAVGLALPMAAVPAVANETVEPVILYGTERGGDDNNDPVSGNIYEIDVANGTATLVYTNQGLSLDTQNYPNGNAFDGINNRLYFSTREGTGAFYSDLYFYDFTNPPVPDNDPDYAGELDGFCAGAEFYQGKYYYIEEGTDNLRVVSFNSNGTIASKAAVWEDFTGGDNKQFGFGDLVITPEGILYGSPSGHFFKIDLNAEPMTYEEISTTGAVGMQLAIGSDGVLYGHSAGTGVFYTIDPATGNTTSIGTVTGSDSGQFTDLASGPYPSIEVVKEADLDPKEATEGEEVFYDYTVTNTGNVPLFDVSLLDDLIDSIELTGLTDEDGDTDADDLAVGASATGRDSYTVPWFTQGPVDNEATATGYYDDSPVTDTDDESVDIVHNPGIELTKIGPPETDPGKEGFGYFESVDADYTYTVENKGDCSLDVTLTDSMIADLGAPTSTGEDETPSYLDPGETWTYEVTEELICEGDTMEVFTNTAIVMGEDAVGQQVWDMACWNVVVFQWQPRTIGYWGNWDNHYDWYEEDGDNNFQALVEAAFTHSANLSGLATHLSWDLTADDDGTDIHDFLLGKPPKLKGNHKAIFLMEKQFLAAAFNVFSYQDWVAPGTSGGFTGTADAAMDPNATVYLGHVDGATALFEADTLTVVEVLHFIAGHKMDWFADEENGKSKLAIAQKVLDMMNNAEHNDYELFVHPDFEPWECPSCLLVGDWLLNVNNGDYMHDMTITSQDVNGNLAGTGGFPAGGPYTITWQLVSSSVTDGSVSLTLDYDASSYWATDTGTVSEDCNSMSGNWTDSGGGSGNWTATRT